MNPLTNLAGRALAFGSSAAVHASVALALSGHGVDARDVRDGTPVAVEVTYTQDLPVPNAMDTSASTPRAARSGQRHAHTHAYPVAKDHDQHPHDPALEHVPEAAPTFALSIPFRVAVAAQAAVSRGAMGTSALGTEGVTNVVSEGAVDTRARLLVGVVPPYPAEAAQAAIEADVPLELVVNAQGTVTDARVLAHVGYGLEQAAVRGARAFRFRPAMLHGRATPVRMTWIMMFRLQ